MAKAKHIAVVGCCSTYSPMVSVVLVSSPRVTELKRIITSSGVHIHLFGFASNANASASADPKASSPRGVLCSNAHNDG